MSVGGASRGRAAEHALDDVGTTVTIAMERRIADRDLNDVRNDGLGEALDADKPERLGRYEVHLDRKLERMLAMLLRLKDLRRPAEPD